MSEVSVNEQLAIDFFAALSTGDLEIIRGVFHEDASWTPMVKDVPGAGVHSPRDVIVDEFLAPVRGIFEDGDPKSEVLNVFAKGDTVCVETRGRGQLRNGNTYDNLYCWVLEIKEGKIFSVKEYMDSHYVMSVV